MENQTSTFYTKDSLKYIPGDCVTAGVIFDGTVYTFNGEILSVEDQFIPYDPDLVATKTKRDLFADDTRLPEDLIEFVSRGDHVPEQGELRRVKSYEIAIDHDTVLPFGALNAPEEYLSEASIKINKNSEGEDVQYIDTLVIPAGLIMGRIFTDHDDTPTFPSHIGRKIKARRHYYDDKNTPPKKDFIEFIGIVVGFEFSQWGLPQYVLKVLREEKSDEHTDRVPKLSRDLYESVHTAYPGSNFVIIDNDFKINFAPEKIGTYRQEFMSALVRAIDARLFKDTIKTVNHVSNSGDQPFWYAHTSKGNYATSATRTLALHMETEGARFLGLQKVEPKYTSKVKAGDIIFGIDIGGEKKKIAWFFSRDYPGFSVFFDFLKDLDKQKELQKTVVTDAKHNNSHTPFSMLLSGYFDPKVDYMIVKKFKNKFLWFL